MLDFFILHQVSDREDKECIGLAEYKSPMYCMYSENVMQLNGIPRKYMAQIQGQVIISQLIAFHGMLLCIDDTIISFPLPDDDPSAAGIVIYYHNYYYLNFMARTDRRSPTGFLVRCSAQTSPLFIIE